MSDTPILNIAGKKSALKSFVTGVPSRKNVIRTTLLGLAGMIGVLNFTPFVSQALQGGALDGVGVCDSFNNVMARAKNHDLAEKMSSMETTKDVYSFASSTKQTICTAKTKEEGADAQYSPVSGRTLVPDLDLVDGKKPAHIGLTTISHEFYHAIQAGNAKKAVTLEEFGRYYDAHSNMLASLYSEAAAFAYETSIRHEYMQKNPKLMSDIEFSMAQDLLLVFEKSYKANASVDEKTRLNLATRAVFEGFLTMQGPAVLARDYYRQQSEKPWYTQPQRLFAFRHAGVNDILPLTQLPNGFQLYRFDRLPEPSEIGEMNTLPLPAAKVAMLKPS